MGAIAWFLQIPPNPRSKSNTNSNRSEQLSFPFGSEQISCLFGRGSVRPSGDKKPQQKHLKTVSWNPHDEVFRQTSRPVTWSMEVEVFIIPARDNAPDEDDEHTIDASCEDGTLAHCKRRSDGLHRKGKSDDPHRKGRSGDRRGRSDDRKGRSDDHNPTAVAALETKRAQRLR